jgi:hypothetical protein
LLATRIQRTISPFATGKAEKSVVKNTTDNMATVKTADPARPEWFHRNPTGKPVGLELDLTREQSLPSQKCSKAVFEQPSNEKEPQRPLIILKNLETSRSSRILNRLWYTVL